MMEIILRFLLLVLGFVMLIKGADWLVDGAAGIAKRFGIPEIIVGLTVVAMGTSAPEAAVSISSALKHNVDIAVGNVLGSNIINILVILGITAIIYPIVIQKETLFIDIPFVFLISCLLVFLGKDGILTKVDGIIFIVLFITYLIYLILTAKKNKENETEKKGKESKEKTVLQLLFLFLIGIIVVVLGSNLTVDSATYIAKSVGLSERIIGLTIIALGTSLPELVTCIMAARKKKPDLAIGNIVGSNIFNILFVLGLTVFITDVPYQSKFILDGIYSLISIALLFFGCVRLKKLTRIGGVVLVLAYLVYMFIFML